VQSDTSVVCDAGPLIHLDELDCLELLADFAQVWVPATVAQEARRLRSLRLDAPGFTIVPDSPLEPQLVSLGRAYLLHQGELAALRLCREHPEALLLTDDAAARLAGMHMGLRVHGTLGLLLRAVRRGLKTKTQVAELISAIPRQSTLFIRRQLLEQALQELTRS